MEFCQVLAGRSFDVQIESMIDDACSKEIIPICLFPGSDAICLEDIDAVDQLERARHSRNLASKGQKEEMNDSEISPYASDEPNRSKYVLIIVDGTWTQAKDAAITDMQFNIIR